jgi:phage terminase large subunit GpA-like protein
VSRPTRVGSGRVSLFTVGTEAAKDLVYARLRVEEAGPGFCHFPSCYDAEYFAQLTAERAVTAWRGGVQVRVYKQTRPRNEALDCRVYALAALRILNVNWKALARRAGVVEARPVEEAAAEYGDREADEVAEVARANRVAPAPQPRPSSRRPRGGAGGFVSRY